MWNSNTAIEYGLGYAEELGYTYSQVIKKINQRTFIEEDNKSCKTAASLKKYIYNCDEIKDKHIILVDDSIEEELQ